jgi:hypothetical protein
VPRQPFAYLAQVRRRPNTLRDAGFQDTTHIRNFDSIWDFAAKRNTSGIGIERMGPHAAFGIVGVKYSTFTSMVRGYYSKYALPESYKYIVLSGTFL